MSCPRWGSGFESRSSATTRLRRAIASRSWARSMRHCGTVIFVMDARNMRRKTVRSSSVTPVRCLQSAGNATFLDLALLFAGVCLGHELLPLVVIVEGHAFAAVSLLDDPRMPDSAARIERDGAWVNEGLLRDGDLFERLISDKGGHYVPVECTGFAKTETLTNDVPEGRGRENGKLDFDDANAAARVQCTERKFRFAVDPALRQRVKHVTPYEPLSRS